MEATTYSISDGQILIEREIDKYMLKVHVPSFNQVTILRNNKDPNAAHNYRVLIYMFDESYGMTSVKTNASGKDKVVKEPADYAPIVSNDNCGIYATKYSEYIEITVDVAGDSISKVSSKWSEGGNRPNIYPFKGLSNWVIPYSTLSPTPYMELKNDTSKDKTVAMIEKAVKSRFTLKYKSKVTGEICNGMYYFAYANKMTNPDKIECMTFNVFDPTSNLVNVWAGFKYGYSRSSKKWSVERSGTVEIEHYSGSPAQTIYSNSKAFLAHLDAKRPRYYLTKYVEHPYEIGDTGITDVDCEGRPVIPDENADSSLSGPIKDLLDANKKTFYLLGKKTGELLPKLYLFDLGQVGGVLTYTHIKDAIVYKQQSCNWIMDTPNKQDLKFSSIEGEVDTNFYLLTMDKLDKPTKITKITLRMANEYLLKYFPTCKVERPEGGQNPDDSLKPDFGGGGGGIEGGGGLFPDVNNPLPNPEIPPCSGQEGGSQTPVSEIYLLSVPELSPTYDDTYDFTDKEAQFRFFASKNSFKVSKYSYLRKDNAIQVGSHVDNLKCYNYLMYKNKAGKWYYCFIMDKQYINERTARIIIATDVIQTYLFDYTLESCFVERCHVRRWKSDGTPTDEFEPENLEFGEPLQVEATNLSYTFKDTYIAVCANPLGLIPSRSILKDDKPKGVDVDGTT